MKLICLLRHALTYWTITFNIFVPLVFCLSLKLKSLLFNATKSGILEALHFKCEPCALNALETELGHTFFDYI